ncbi:putative NAD(P)H quinone oxidoreductase, PIG3 family [bacterium A37T11]|nr:putative NAD(P)H quinone oxidoreductase, PIG3 family [bacterium A37T11]
MKVIAYTEPGGPEVLRIEERPMPKIGREQVLIQVKAAGVNRPDIFQRRGNYPAPSWVEPNIPGLEVAGIITACGEQVSSWKPGDHVCALLAGGGYAEYAVVNAGHCLPIPKNFDFADAASLPETIFTVWHNVFQRGQLKEGEHILVQGGSGGIGTAAIQLAHFFGARVYSTAGSSEQCQYCLDLGALRCFNYRVEDFYEGLKETGIDVILDSFGADYFERHFRLLRDDGRLIVINAVSGSEVQLPLVKLMSRRLTITGSTLRNRDNAFKSSLAAEVKKYVWPLLDAGKYKVTIHQKFKLEEAQKAHTLMEKGGFTGKLILLTGC